MAFKPVNKEDQTKDQFRMAISVELIGEPAVFFKKMAEDTKISGKELVTQMVHYCINEARSAAEAKKA